MIFVRMPARCSCWSSSTEKPHLLLLLLAVRQRPFDCRRRAPEHFLATMLPSQRIEAKVVAWWRSTTEDLQTVSMVGKGLIGHHTSTLRVITYSITSSHPFDVMAAPATQYHQYGITIPVIAAMRPAASGSVQQTYTTGKIIMYFDARFSVAGSEFVERVVIVLKFLDLW